MSKEHMSKLVFPGSETVPLPRLEFEVPEGWHVEHPDRVLFCVVNRREGFSPNIVVAHERRSPDVPLDQVLADITGYARSLPEVQVVGSQCGKRGEHLQEWAVVEYVYAHQIGQLACMLAVLVVRHDGVADCYRFHATATGEHADGDLRVIHGMVESVVCPS